MPAQRCRAVLPLALAVLVPWVWNNGAADRYGRRIALVAEQPYAVAVMQDRAVLDLPFESGTRYLLIVSSLAPTETAGTIRLSAERRTAAEIVPVRPLAPLAGLVSNRPVRVSGPVGNLPHKAEPCASAAERTFYLHVAEGSPDDPRGVARIAARLVGEGRAARVYLDRQLEPQDLAPGLVAETLRLFDETVLPCAGRWLGTCRDIDGDGKFTILLTPWLDRLQGGRTALGGLVRGSDFRRDVPAPLGNRADLLFLNANLSPGPHLRTLLAHEFTHAIAFSERLPGGLNRDGLPAEDDWLNEALAHLAENLHGLCWTNLDHRIAAFLNEPQRYPLVVADYYGSGLWRDPGCRGSTYLFLRWCVDQYGNGLLGRLIAGPFRGRRNIAWATGVPFDELFRHWSVALFRSGRGIAGARRTAEARPGFTTLDLSDRLGTWGLAGPAIQTWDTAAPLALSVAGTSSAFVMVHPHDGTGVRRVRVEATPGQRLQVSLIPLATDGPEIRLAARWANAPTASPGESTDAVVGVTVERPRGGRVAWIGCQSHVPTPRAVCWSAEELHRQGLRISDASDSVRVALPLPGHDAVQRAWTVTALYVDERGRRATARAVVTGRTGNEARIELASAPARPAKR